jgi:hypothetical protein
MQVILQAGLSSILGMIDGAFAMSGHDNMQFVAIAWFLCVANDIIAGILAFVALLLQPAKADSMMHLQPQRKV